MSGDVAVGVGGGEGGGEEAFGVGAEGGGEGDGGGGGGEGDGGGGLGLGWEVVGWRRGGGGLLGWWGGRCVHVWYYSENAVRCGSDSISWYESSHCVVVLIQR